MAIEDEVLARVSVEKLLLRVRPQRDAWVLRMHFGLGGGYWTLREIGDYLGCTQERVRQIETRALNRLNRMVRYGLEGR